MSNYEFIPNTKNLLNLLEQNASRVEEDSLFVISTVVMSVVVLESFINETYEMVRYLQREHRDDWINGYGLELKDKVEDRVSIHEKWLWALSYLAKSEWNKGSRPYQDFKLLIELRNAIVHNKPDVYVYERELGENRPERGMDDYEKFIKKICSDTKFKHLDLSVNWFKGVQDPVISNWAVETCHNMIDTYIGLISNEGFKSKVKQLTSRSS